MKQVRLAALDTLCATDNKKAYLALVLKSSITKANFTDERDVNLLSSLVYGVYERKITLDYNIGLYIKSSVKKLHPKVLNNLRLGAYQILFMQKIPISAAVNESVKLAKLTGHSYASGLINAVLRKISANGLMLPDKSDKNNYLSVKYSFAPNLVNSFVSDYGEENAIKIMSAAFGRRPMYIRVNTLKTSDAELFDILKSEGVTPVKQDTEHCISLEDTGDITALSSFKNGLFYVQDMSSQMCSLLLGAKPGENIADCCAAPGGKSFTIAQCMNNEGSILAADIYEQRTELIEDGAKRLSISCIKTVCKDACELNKTYFGLDRVLCDVPCSGFGVTGRKPEIKYKSYEDIKELTEIQKNILFSCSQLVKPGGVLMYSTCTLNKAENDRVCDEFLLSHPDFCVSTNEQYIQKCTGRYITVFPDEKGGDGFFVAKFVRNNK